MKNVVTRINEPTDYISLDEVKSHLRVITTGDDAYISNLLNAAFDYVSKYLGYEVVRSTVAHFFTNTEGSAIHIPARVISLTSIHYRNTDGDLTAFTDYDEILTLSADYGMDIQLLSYPSTYDYGWKWKVTVQEGFGTLGDNLDVSKTFPDAIRHAIYLLCEHWYTQRGAGVVGATATDLPFNHEYLLAPYKISEFA